MIAAIKDEPKSSNQKFVLVPAQLNFITGSSQPLLLNTVYLLDTETGKCAWHRCMSDSGKLRNEWVWIQGQ